VLTELFGLINEVFVHQRIGLTVRTQQTKGKKSMHSRSTSAQWRLKVLSLLMAVAMVGNPAQAQDTKALDVGILYEPTTYDPQRFLRVNFPILRNLYDSLIEYSPEGLPVPRLATDWSINGDNTSVTVTLREDVAFASGALLTAQDVAATLAKASDPERGGNIYSTTSILSDWSVQDDQTIVINFNNSVPTRQITDFLQSIMPIEAVGIESVDTVPAGTGPFVLETRAVGQSMTLSANPEYWGGTPDIDAVNFTIFSDQAAAAAGLESGAIDLIYGSNQRNAARLERAGFQVLRGPGPLVQTLRINSTHPPFDNDQFRQAFNYLVDREGMLKVGYAGLGEVVALPWAPSSPAFDPAYAAKFAYDPEKAKALIEESGLSAEAASDWILLINGGDEAAVILGQILQASLQDVGINVDLELRQGSEYAEAQLTGDYDATFGAVGNVQKFPSRVATNSIYRDQSNPVLGEPHPHPEYVAAIERINRTIGEEATVQAAYDELNRVLVAEAFAVPTNTVHVGLIVAAPEVSGFELDTDNLFVARSLDID
jgi:peptide/nickel transport system substrate-binding protein